MLRVVAIFRESPGVKTFRLMEPMRAPIPFDFLPGQFATISSEIKGQRLRRSYTIASSPTQRDFIEVTIKREEQGLESRHLHDEVTTGDLVEISGPYGAFTFTGDEADSIVLIAGGVGVTPMMSVIRYLTDRAYPGDIYLLYGAKSPNHVIFRQELRYLGRRHPNFHFLPTVLAADGTSWSGAKGVITKEFIAGSVPELARRRVHICGPPAMMDAVKAALAELGVPAQQVKTEAFGPAKGTSPPAEAIDVPPSRPLPAAGASTAVGPATASVVFRRSDKKAPLPPDRSVLEVAESIGVAIDYECRVGTCGRCKVRLLEGAVTMEVEDGLETGDKQKGLVLACQAKSIGDLIVDA